MAKIDACQMNTMTKITRKHFKPLIELPHYHARVYVKQKKHLALPITGLIFCPYLSRHFNSAVILLVHAL